MNGLMSHVAIGNAPHAFNSLVLLGVELSDKVATPPPPPPPYYFHK
jgi:hypothetical protein